MSWTRSSGYVLIAFVVQIVGYAALLTIFPHSQMTPLVVELRVLPTVVLSVLAVIAIPAVLLGLGLGTALSVVLGVRPESFPVRYIPCREHHINEPPELGEST